MEGQACFDHSGRIVMQYNPVESGCFPSLVAVLAQARDQPLIHRRAFSNGQLPCMSHAGRRMQELLQSPFACATTVAYGNSGKSLDLKTFASAFPLLRQAIRYGFVGVLHNLLGYLLYLLVTFLGADPKLAITVLYPVGATAAYFGHLKYSFTYRGRYANALPRYALAHLVGYGVNFTMLFIFSDKLKLPHQAVQASAVLVVAGVLFLMFKYFVFPRSEHGDVMKP